MRFPGRLMMVVAAGALVFAGCSDDNGSDDNGSSDTSSDDGGSADESGDGVEVVLSEFVVIPTPESTDAGEVAFTADNQGAEEHELVVAKGESAEALPTDADGAVDEDQFEPDQLIGEIEDIAAGASDEVSLDMEVGDYVLFCNIVEEEDDGTVESHFVEGMYATFTVE